MWENKPGLKKIASYLGYGLGILVLLALASKVMNGQSLFQPTNDQGGYSSEDNRVGVAAVQRGEWAAPSPAMRSVNGGNMNTKRAATSNNSAAPSVADRKIIKNDALSLLVHKTEAAVEQIKSIATNLNGFVDEANVYEQDDGSKSGSVTVKVPANKFEDGIKSIKALAVKVERENVSASDTTANYIDLEARLKNLQATETQYLAILREAKKVADIVSVTKELTDVRGDIESLQGQIKNLDRQIDLSEIRVSLDEEADAQVFGLHWQPLVNIKQSLRNALQSLTSYVDALFALLFAIPVLILWAITLVAIYWVVRKVYRFIKRRFFYEK